MSSALRRNHFDRRDEELKQRDEELKCLSRLVRDLELEVRGRRRRRDKEEQEEGSASIEGHHRAGSYQSGSHRHRERSREYIDRDSISPKKRQPWNTTMDTMRCALHWATRSPFSRDIERASMPSRFTWLPFNSYDEKTNPVEHVSHYIQMMSSHTYNDALMCKVFPSSLSPTALRWFNGLRKGSILSFSELIQEFGVRFMTYSRVPQLMNALLSMKMGVGETLCSYTNRYWKLYNEIDRGNEKMGLPEDSKLQDSLTRRPPEDMRQLMRYIEENKRLEDDRLQSKGKAPVINHPRQSGLQSRPWKELRIQEPGPQVGEVIVAFKELVHRIMDRIKNESYLWWLNKMGGDPSRRNQNLYCTYHRDKGHTTEQCRVLKDHLEQLVKARYLKEFVINPRSQEAGQGIRPRRNPLPPPLGVIEVIHVTLRGSQVSKRKGVLTVVLTEGSTDD
ncbi:uncharacterized protein LOC126704104 [Quercus robur]|uniref:uncharacterized protein LOC126704104 n=1 Tax=Quercus robur TaxID=38942 RepID=UPI0021612835|nr:uncharacterized protein LOC126704104 [Quercus robur]